MTLNITEFQKECIILGSNHHNAPTTKVPPAVLSPQFVYLAGPIAGCDDGEANDWRNYVMANLDFGIIGVSPLRCEPPKEDGTYDTSEALQQNNVWFRTPRCIKGKNWMDTVKADLVFAYMPNSLVAERPSYGTSIEIGWAIGMDKPYILVSDSPSLVNHPLITMTAAGIFPDLDDAIDATNDLLGVYAHV